MLSKIKEIIPVEDRLEEELSRINGGKSSSAIICDSGVLCEAGAIDVPTQPDEGENINPSGSKMV